jgi:hypothetical protein
MQAERISRRYDVKALHIVLVTIVAAVTLTSVAAAGPDAAKQRVAITMKNLPNGKFVLEPLQAGTLERDSGTTSVVYKRVNVVIREGQTVDNYRSTFTLEGKRGILTIREQIEWVYAGGPFIGLGTWKVVRGTGEYAQISGGGRTAGAGLNHGNGAWTVHEEGFLTPK